jgi:hypothetical protein
VFLAFSEVTKIIKCFVLGHVFWIKKIFKFPLKKEGMGSKKPISLQVLQTGPAQTPLNFFHPHPARTNIN